MPDNAAILTALREELIAASLGRRPSEAVAGRHPIHIERDEGPPAPGEAEGVEDDAALVMGLELSGEMGEASGYDAATRRRAVINVRYRSATNAALRETYGIDKAIRARLIRPETFYGYGFMLGTAAAIFCHQAAPFGGIGPLERGRGRPFDHVAKWLIEVNPG